ncbi:hypothetical protein [Bremerella sp.]|uniref:hypothetical protein n=1 Tax=Bremerella sp. TaxID=2795602 RepID=UPI00391B0FAA
MKRSTAITVPGKSSTREVLKKMWQVRRILVVIGSAESSWARTISHRQALDCLQDLPECERWEVVFLDVTPKGQFEFPTEIPEDGRYTGDAFSKFEAIELLRSIRLDFACSFLACRTGRDIFSQIVHDLKLQPLRVTERQLRINKPRWKVGQAISSQASILNRFRQIHPN